MRILNRKSLAHTLLASLPRLYKIFAAFNPKVCIRGIEERVRGL